MKILIVTNTYPPADITGVGALAVELAAAFSADGHEIRVLTREAPADDRWAVAVGGRKVLFPLIAAWRYARLGGAWDLVHVHESDGAFVVILTRLGRLLGLALGRARLVATLQVSYLREMRVVRPVKADGVVVSRPTGEELVFRWLRAPLHLLLGCVTARLADAVVAPSRKTASELEEDYAAEVEAIVPNGLDPETIAAAAKPPAAAPISRLVLYAGRLRTRKAVAVLLVAFARVLRSVPTARLAVVGAGEQRAALNALAVRLELGDRVTFVGAVPRAAMVAWYARADVFCLPSTYEGFPVAIVEAMAYGLPVVATRVAGIPEAVIDGETGFIVEPEDATALADRLERLLTDDALREAMGRASAARFRSEYTLERVARAYMDVYARVVAAGRPK